MQVLIVEDEPNIKKLLRAYLEKEGFSVDDVGNGSRALTMVSQNNYDLIILDIMLPELNGWSVCQSIRKQSNVPIIMVTAKSTETDRILGLELGADDYLVKPFSPKELIARIKALFRRIRNSGSLPSPTQDLLTFGNLSINYLSRQASVNGQVIPLTPKEFLILYTLAKQPDRTFSLSCFT